MLASCRNILANVLLALLHGDCGLLFCTELLRCALRTVHWPLMRTHMSYISLCPVLDPSVLFCRVCACGGRFGLPFLFGVLCRKHIGPLVLRERFAPWMSARLTCM